MLPGLRTFSGETSITHCLRHLRKVKTIPSFVLGRLNASTYQPRTPRRSNSLRPCWMIVLTILLLFMLDTNANAQLDRLRKSNALSTVAVSETPMVEIPEGLFTMGLDGIQAL